MLSYDYFIQFHQYLRENKRYKEEIDLCEYAISSAVWPTGIERQCEALCRWSLAETYFYHIGDAKKAREKYSNFLSYIDEDWSIISADLSRQEVMEDMYVKACLDIGQLAISYDEYFSYIRKSEKARPLTPSQKGQIKAVEYNRNKGLSWCDNIIQLAEVGLSSVKSGAIDRLAGTVAIYSLLLLYTEEIDTPIDALRIALINYSSLVCQLVGESILRCAAKNHPANPDNYRFIFEQAIDLVGEFSEDMEILDEAKDAQNKLIEARSESIDKSNFHKYGYASVSPPNVQDYIPPLVLKEQIKTSLSNVGMQQFPKLGCTTVAMMVLLLLAIITTLILAL